jgi:hypothetical protein
VKSPPAAADRLTRRLRATSAALFAAASLCLLLQANDPLWLDELHTVWTARGSWSEIFERGALGNQSPPFFLLEALVGRVLGFDPLAMRGLSALAGAASIVTLFRFVARSSRSIATGLALSVSLLTWPTLVFYFVEARPYALVFFAATILWTSLAEALSLTPSRDEEEEDDKRRRRIARARILWIAGLSSTIWLHPTALLLVVPVALALALSLTLPRGRANYSARARALDLVIAAAICAAGTPFWYALYQRRGAWSAFIHSPDVWDWIANFQLVAFIGVPMLTILATLAVASFRRDRKGTFTTDNTPFCSAAFCGLAFATPVLLASVGTWFDLARVYHFRYLIGAVAALPMFAAALVVAARPTWLRTSATVLFVGVLFWFSGGATTFLATGRIVPSSRQENWAGLVECLNHLPAGPVLLDADVIESKRWADSDDPRQREYLAFALRAFLSMQDRTIQSVSYDPRDEVALHQRAMEEAQRSGRLYAVIRGGGAAPAKMIGRLKNQLPAGFEGAPTIESFGRVWLITYERDAQAP